MASRLWAGNGTEVWGFRVATAMIRWRSSPIGRNRIQSWVSRSSEFSFDILQNVDQGSKSFQRSNLCFSARLLRSCKALKYEWNKRQIFEIPPIRGSPLPTGDVCCSSLIAKHPDSAPSEK
ncbi:hypothetical protein PDE_09258 [Penicillium oxalicum 114-2]|uniref:Uncharacterized protein n=1 Tax=Penicillium oxalicum (strain 114-2 / CGMCC 5302) TaxID=933388 RepID=S7ZV55_PENO1|nr:hypothetical protein PDE_09258 [Penicillium oxalicum 114-2]